MGKQVGAIPSMVGGRGLHSGEDDRMSSVRAVVDGLTPASLDAVTEPIDAPGWPPPIPLEVRECLLVVLNEEYHHRLFAERDLDALTS